MRKLAILFSILIGALVLLSPQTIFASQSNFTSGCVNLTASQSVGGAPFSVSFVGEGFDQGHSIAAYEFDFGDASGGQPRIVRQASSAATHRYYNPGTYTASLKIKTSKGEFVDGGNCKKIIVVATSVAGAKTTINTLPKTGIKDYMGVLSVILILSGIYLRRHFKLN